MHKWLEAIGDGVIIFCGLLLVYIFLTIEVWGIYGAEANALIRRFELGTGIAIILLGLYHLIQDLRKV